MLAKLHRAITSWWEWPGSTRRQGVAEERGNPSKVTPLKVTVATPGAGLASPRNFYPPPAPGVGRG